MEVTLTVPSQFYFCTQAGKQISLEKEKVILISDVAWNNNSCYSILIQVSMIETNSNVNTSKQVVTNFTTWTTDDVVMFLKTLKLSKDYSEIIKQNNVNGEVLETMTRSDWQEVGITVFGDLRILTTAVRKLTGS